METWVIVKLSKDPKKKHSFSRLLTGLENSKEELQIRRQVLLTGERLAL
jgi:hypothetical protein